MSMYAYQKLCSYKNSRILFDLTWEFADMYYAGKEYARQRDQMKQAVRSTKQNIVEGSEERSLSSTLKLYDVARASVGELQEDYGDIMRKDNVLRWDKNDPRLRKLQHFFESPSSPSYSSCSSVLSVVRGERGDRGIRWDKEDVEIIVNYCVDLCIRTKYLLDQQIRAVEKKHETEGGYRENLLRKRLRYRKGDQ